MQRTRLQDLPIPVKVLLTSFLLTIGMAYIFAFLYLYLIDIEPHRGAGMGLLEGTIHKYYGNKGNTPLEKALKGTMGERLTEDAKREIARWIQDGATAEVF